MRFTEKGIQAIRPKKTRVEFREPGRTGLVVRVTPHGEKSWEFRYRFGGRQKRMLLGDCATMALADARITLGNAKKKLKVGIDPGVVAAEERRAEREAETVKELCDEYMERHAKPNKKPSSAAEDQRLIDVEIIPEIGTRKAKDVTRRDIIKLLDKIEDREAPVTRNRVTALLSKLFMFALNRGIVQASPAVGIPRLNETPRERVLTVEEIETFWTGLDKAHMTPQVRLALKLALVTGQRRGEIAGIPRTEIDDAERLWRLPAVRTKSGRDNLIPLPPLALRLIEEADTRRVRPPPTRPNRKDRKPHDPTPSPWLFPSWRLDKPIQPAALSRALNRNRAVLGIGDATVHDLRRTFATCHGEIGTPPEILSALLNHAPETITAKVYNKAVNLEPRRTSMTAWCDWLEGVIAGKIKAATVVPIRADAA